MAKKQPTLQTLKGFTLGDYVVTTETRFGFNQATLYIITHLERRNKPSDDYWMNYNTHETLPDAYDYVRLKEVWSFKPIKSHVTTGYARSILSLKTCVKIDLLDLLKNFQELEKIIKAMMVKGTKIDADQDTKIDDELDTGT